MLLTGGNASTTSSSSRGFGNSSPASGSVGKGLLGSGVYGAVSGS